MSDPVVPPLPEALLAPLLDAAGEVLRGSSRTTYPRPLRPLARLSCQRDGAGAARQQLRTALDSDEAFRKRVVEAFLDRPEVQAALDGLGTPRDAPARIDEAAARSDLPLLASALVAARPAGWTFGLGLAAATFERSRSVHEADAALQALEPGSRKPTKQAAAPEDAKAAAEDKCPGAWSTSCTRSAAHNSSATIRRNAPSTPRTPGRRRVGRRVSGCSARPKRRARESARARSSAWSKPSSAPPHATRRAAPEITLRDRDLQALVDASELANRLAKGLGGVADRVRLLRARRPRRHRTASGGPGSGSPPGFRETHPKRSRRCCARRRGRGDRRLQRDEAGVARVWLSEQRDRLVSALAALHPRTALRRDGRVRRRRGRPIPRGAPPRCAGAVLGRQRGSRCGCRARSRRATTAVPVLVVSSDHEVRDQSEAEGRDRWCRPTRSCARCVPEPATATAKQTVPAAGGVRFHQVVSTTPRTHELEKHRDVAGAVSRQQHPLVERVSRRSAPTRTVSQGRSSSRSRVGGEPGAATGCG